MLSYGSFHLPLPSRQEPRPAKHKKTEKERKLAKERGRGWGKEPNHTTARKLGSRHSSSWFTGLHLQAYFCRKIWIKMWYALNWLCNIYKRYIHETLRNPWYKSAIQKNCSPTSPTRHTGSLVSTEEKEFGSCFTYIFITRIKWLEISYSLNQRIFMETFKEPRNWSTLTQPTRQENDWPLWDNPEWGGGGQLGEGPSWIEGRRHKIIKRKNGK